MNTPKYTQIAARLKAGAKFCLNYKKHMFKFEYFYLEEIPNTAGYISHWIRNEKDKIVGAVLTRQSTKNKFFLILIYSGLVEGGSRTKLMFDELTFEGYE